MFRRRSIFLDGGVGGYTRRARGRRPTRGRVPSRSRKTAPRRTPPVVALTGAGRAKARTQVRTPVVAYTGAGRTPSLRPKPVVRTAPRSPTKPAPLTQRLPELMPRVQDAIERVMKPITKKPVMQPPKTSPQTSPSASSPKPAPTSPTAPSPSPSETSGALPGSAPRRQHLWSLLDNPDLRRARGKRPSLSGL